MRTAEQHTPAVLNRVGDERVDQPTLADAGLAQHDADPGVPLPGFAHARGAGRHRCLAAHQGSVGNEGLGTRLDWTGGQATLGSFGHWHIA